MENHMEVIPWCFMTKISRCALEKSYDSAENQVIFFRLIPVVAPEFQAWLLARWRSCTWPPRTPRQKYEGFQGRTPIAGWFSGKIPLKWMITGGSPILGKPNSNKFKNSQVPGPILLPCEGGQWWARRYSVSIPLFSHQHGSFIGFDTSHSPQTSLSKNGRDTQKKCGNSHIFWKLPSMGGGKENARSSKCCHQSYNTSPVTKNLQAK